MKNWMTSKVRPLQNVAIVMTVAAFGLAACGEEEAAAPTETSSGVYSFTVQDNDLVIGNRDAEITIVEYSSMTCPHCALFHEEIYPEIKKKYLDSGKAKLVFRPFPLDGYAAQAAMLTQCAPERIKMPLIDAMFSRQRTWMYDEKGPVEGLVKIAREAQISREAFAECVADEKTQAWLKSHIDAASETYGVNSTPTFYVNGEKTAPIRDFAQFDRIMAKFTGELEPAEQP